MMGVTIGKSIVNYSMFYWLNHWQMKSSMKSVDKFSRYFANKLTQTDRPINTGCQITSLAEAVVYQNFELIVFYCFY